MEFSPRSTKKSAPKDSNQIHHQQSPLFGQGPSISPIIKSSSREAEALGLAGFARGNEIHMAPGLTPASGLGAEVMAHEQVHVQQQALGKGKTGGFGSAPQLEHEAQTASPSISPAPYGMMQGFSVAGREPSKYEPYQFQSLHFQNVRAPVKDTLRSWHFGGMAEGFEVPYADRLNVEAKRALQEAINRINRDTRFQTSELHLEEDGQFGTNTAKAVRDFQKAHGLAVDGVIGAETAKKIDEVLAKVEANTGYRVSTSRTTRANSPSFTNFDSKEEPDGSYSKGTVELSLDTGRRIGFVGWGGQNYVTHTREIIGMLKYAGYLDLHCGEAAADNMVHYSASINDTNYDRVAMEHGESQTFRIFNEPAYYGEFKGMAGRYHDSKLPKTIAAIMEFQKRYGYTQTGRIEYGSEQMQKLKELADRGEEESIKRIQKEFAAQQLAAPQVPQVKVPVRKAGVLPNIRVRQTTGG